ncbi:Histidine kinase-, DNA gyrase B-, and HSP90-like ATPase [Brevibacterium sandarakinum]|uniref:Histidine kinase-, DNA gyrase B-, and HSP90-like ATPase n=2 Tax=Brevibacterium sandarakinum TaxID=629680 RepID=A0A1H1RSW1_BRESA|nr:Histidine kinase-, DNA gyrase B-, and HSP90-like ATPase [Brevibacterium sandarakinum]
MEDLVLTASDDHVARLAHEGDPVRAVIELIWNAVDAEATTVTVDMERSSMEAIDQVRVEDDGHGISSDEVAATFGRIGGSWKSLSEKSKNGKRQLHGKLGEGRLRAFALGSRVSWVSISDNTAGQREQITITGSRSSRDRFRWDTAPFTAAATGTIVTARNDEQRSLGALDADDVIATLRSHFAPLLLNDPSLTIVYDGSALDPSQEVVDDATLPLDFGENGAHRATMRIIEWRTGKHRAVYFGPDADHFPFETSGSAFESQFAYSAYVTWDMLGIEELSALGLGDMAPDEVGELWTAAREAIRDHFNARRRERRREQVEHWKETGVYPYRSEPANDMERAERAVFDVVSGSLVPHISKTKNQAQLTLELLRDAIRHDPEKLTTILHEVVALNEADRDTLTKLLSETTLSAIIRSANVVASRHKFLVALEHLLFDPDDSGKVGERDHLHKVLEHELWVFGESYHLMSTERSLTELLRNHLKLDGLPTKDVATVRRWDGKTGRTDLHLAARNKEHDRIRHLVVELKAPDITASRRELDQVEDYANAILSTAAFTGDRTSWDIILVVTDYDDLVRRRITGEDPDIGLFFDPQKEQGRPLVRAYVRRWREVIDENKRRLEFMTHALEHDPSITEGLQYVRDEYSDLLPEELRVSGQEEDEPSSVVTPAGAHLG